MQPDRNDNRPFLDGEDSRLGFLGACREISDGLTLLQTRQQLADNPIVMGLTRARFQPNGQAGHVEC